MGGGYVEIVPFRHSVYAASVGAALGAGRCGGGGVGIALAYGTTETGCVGGRL